MASLLIIMLMSVTAQIAAVCRGGYYQLWQLWPLQWCATGEITKTLTNTFIASWLHYCNILRYRRGTIEPSAITPERRCSSRYRFLGRREFTTPVVRQLHWSDYTTRLQELLRPTCPTIVTYLHQLECALCAQLTPGHVYLVAHTMVTVFAVLPLPS